jgi:hypothetical protein
MVVVVGAGMAGLLAASMLRNECTEVIESQAEIPNNHSAVLRFRTTSVADVLNIPFKPVRVLKATHPWKNPVADAMAYSYKTNGTSQLRSIADSRGSVETRYIAPSNLIQHMTRRVSAPFRFGCKVTGAMLRAQTKPIISTVPMPVLMKLLQWGKSATLFRYVDGVNITATVEDTNTYCSLYVPDPAVLAARISITGNQLIIECPQIGLPLTGGAGTIIRAAAALIGVDVSRISAAKVKPQKYAKILPIDEGVRKRFILWASENHNVYSLGRFATWRPGLLLDDVVNDVRVIHKLINGGSSYDYRK